MLMITTFLPLFKSVLPPVIRSHHLLTPIWFIALLSILPGVLFNKQFLYVFCYGGIFLSMLLLDLFWIGTDAWTKSMLLNEVYMFVVAFSLVTYFQTSKDLEGWAWVSKWTMVLVGITALLSIMSSFVDPLYARKIFSANIEELEELTKYGGGGYGFSSSLVCLFPIIIYYYRNNSKIIFSRIHIASFGILCFVALVRMQIYANILVATVIIGFSLIGRTRKKQSIIIAIMLLTTVFIIPRQFYSNIFTETSHFFNRGTLGQNKLTDFATYLNVGGVKGTEAGYRAARYPLLLKAFLDDPLLGYFSTNGPINVGPGAHLYWMYRLAVFGLAGFLPFLIIFYLHIKNTHKILEQEFSYYFLLSAFSIIALGLMKNLAGRELWYMYFFIIPGLNYLPLLKVKPRRLFMRITIIQ